MKTLIIIEGMDNTGKDTLISGITNKFNDKYNYICEHFTGPSSKEKNKAFIEQINQFLEFLYKLTLYNDNSLIFWNRSHIGEYVYGQIYRNIDKNLVIKMINLIDELLLSLNINIVYVQLICNSNELMIKNEDGKSLSTSIEKDKYIETLDTERKLFKEAFKVVSDKFKKIMIIVNNGDSFIDKNIILNEVIEKIYE